MRGLEQLFVSNTKPGSERCQHTTALSTTGLHLEAYDLPALGAALRLMSSRPIRREFLDEQGSSRSAEEVPPGAISASMRDLRERFEPYERRNNSS